MYGLFLSILSTSSMATSSTAAIPFESRSTCKQNPHPRVTRFAKKRKARAALPSPATKRVL